MSLKLHLIIGFIFVYKFLKIQNNKLKSCFFFGAPYEGEGIVSHHLLKNLHSKIGRRGNNLSLAYPHNYVQII